MKKNLQLYSILLWIIVFIVFILLVFFTKNTNNDKHYAEKWKKIDEKNVNYIDWQTTVSSSKKWFNNNSYYEK